MLMKNKRAMSLPILVLVILTIVLVFVSLFYFSSRDKQNKETLMIPSVIDELYRGEARLNFHLRDIFEKSVKNMQETKSQDVFISSFKDELNRFKSQNGNYLIQGMEQVESQLNNKNIIIDSEKVILTLEIELFASKKDDKQDTQVNYKYIKQFEKVFKG